MSVPAGLTVADWTTWRAEQQERWQRDEESRQTWCPASESGERAGPTGPLGYWQAIAEPIPPPDEVTLVIADLDRGGDVEVERHGRVRHHRRCHAAHQLRQELEGVAIPATPFLVDLTLYPPPVHPKARILDPEISLRRFPGHPHFYAPDIVCPIFPPEGTWSWHRHLISDYLDQVAIWLVKSSVWIVTHATRGRGIWLGPDAPHDPQTLLRTVRPDDDCPCAMGQKYKRCCRNKHVAMVNNSPKGVATPPQRGPISRDIEIFPGRIS